MLKYYHFYISVYEISFYDIISFFLINLKRFGPLETVWDILPGEEVHDDLWVWLV